MLSNIQPNTRNEVLALIPIFIAIFFILNYNIYITRKELIGVKNKLIFLENANQNLSISVLNNNNGLAQLVDKKFEVFYTNIAYNQGVFAFLITLIILGSIASYSQYCYTLTEKNSCIIKQCTQDQVEGLNFVLHKYNKLSEHLDTKFVAIENALSSNYMLYLRVEKKIVGSHHNILKALETLNTSLDVSLTGSVYTVLESNSNLTTVTDVILS